MVLKRALPELGARTRWAKLLATILRGAGVVLVFALIWGPWLVYNEVPEARLESGVIEKARRVPDDALLDELASYSLGMSFPWETRGQLLEAAEKLLIGQIELPGFQTGRFESPFHADTMAYGSGKWQLFIHSLGLPKVLLDAYQADGRPDFLRAAADYLVAYDAYEGGGWKPGGYLWRDTWSRYVRNDHAVAARVPVLAQFWKLYRNSPDYRPDVAKAVFRMVARCAYLLSDPSRFTYATNHGVMQNLGLLNLSLSFPTLADVEGNSRLAFNRLDEQLTFFLDDEGFVLEHSPGYQSFGIRLMGIAFRYLTLLGLKIPEPWLRKYQKAQQVYAELRRSDGTLPVFGDTDGGPDVAGPVVTKIDDAGHAGRLIEQAWSARDERLFAPVAGYCVWWDGLDNWPDPDRLSQTAIAWSNFAEMGHKHADEMSLSVWAGGTSWWANVGYWPYDDTERGMAESWEGSNAPHRIGEPPDGARETRLRYHGREGHLAAIDLERRGSGSYRARRQVVHVGPKLWVVVDTSSGNEGNRTRTIWTTTPGVRLTETGAGGAYTLQDRSSGQSLQAYFLGDTGVTRRTVEGSRSPFGGWFVVDGMIRPSPAVIFERPADGSWSLAVWSLTDGPVSGPELTGVPRMLHWAGDENWELVLPIADGLLKLQRRQGRIDTSSTQDSTGSLDLVPGPNVSNARAELHAAFAAAAVKYGVADMSGVYRLKVTMVLLAALLLNTVVLRFSRRFRAVWTQTLSIFLSTGWVLLACYFVFIRAHLV